MGTAGAAGRVLPRFDGGGGLVRWGRGSGLRRRAAGLGLTGLRGADKALRVLTALWA